MTSAYTGASAPNYQVIPVTRRDEGLLHHRSVEDCADGESIHLSKVGRDGEI